MEYLTLEDAVNKKKDIADALDLLLSNKALTAKPNALQWKFLRDCINVLLYPKVKSKFSSFSKSHKAQLKYEAEDKLKKYYLRPGRKINYVFHIVHQKELKNIFNDENDDYPNIGGYSVLVRDTSNEVTHDHSLTEKDIKEYIERVVAESVDTEFEAYQTLPNIIEDELLDGWFCPFGPAKKEILHILSRHKERGWVLTNYMNPSTKRILNIKIRKIERKEIFVATTEYWYLRWWDAKKNSYTFPYRETNRQLYILRKDNGIWKVYESIRPSPRTSIPHRRKYL